MSRPENGSMSRQDHVQHADGPRHAWTENRCHHSFGSPSDETEWKEELSPREATQGSKLGEWSILYIYIYIYIYIYYGQSCLILMLFVMLRALYAFLWLEI